MRVLSRLAGWMLGAALTIGCGEPAPLLPAVGRPASVSQGPRVAVIVAVRGQVLVEPGQGDSFAAHQELQLLRDDHVTVRSGSFVVLALHNGYLVRLNEGVKLRIDELASFNDEPIGTDLGQRFSLLLSPTEREDAELRGAITRVAGWNTRMTAADTIPTQSAPQRVASPPALPPAIESEPAQSGALGSSRSADAPSSEVPTDPVEGAEPLADPVDAKKNRPHPEPVGGGGVTLPPSEPDGIGGAPPPASEPPSKPQDSPKAEEKDEANDDAPGVGASGNKKPDKQPTSTLDLPKVVRYQRDLDGKRMKVSLPGPLQLQRLELARCAGKGAVVRGQIRARRLVALQVGGVVSKCVPALIGKAVALEDGWIEMTVLP